MKSYFTLRQLLGTAVLLLCTCPLFGMNNDDVIKMVNAQLSEETIILAVKSAEPADFDTSAMALVALKEKNVSEAIIQAMIRRTSGPEAAEEPEATGPGKLKGTDVPDAEVLPPEIDPQSGNEYYTRYTFKFEKGERPATNYWRGEMVPINTKVTYLGTKRDRFTLKLVDSGQTIVVENVPKFTTRSVEQLLREMLSAEPTKIEKYGEEMARSIRTGTLRLGMTKTQVLLARGYPPGHETPSLENDAWKYWSSRFVVQTLVFDHDVLVQGRGVY